MSFWHSYGKENRPSGGRTNRESVRGRLYTGVPFLGLQPLIIHRGYQRLVFSTPCYSLQKGNDVYELGDLQVRVLVEEGKADLAVADRWGATPLDEAMRVGSRAVMDYLQVN